MTNRIFTISKKASLIFWGIMVCFHASAQNLTAEQQENLYILSELQDYFYPFGDFSYKHPSNSESEYVMFSTYSLSPDGLILHETIEMCKKSSLYSCETITANSYKLEQENRAIISTQQIYRNILTGTSTADDKITLFVLPKGSEIVKWTETVNGGTMNCTAKFVQLTNFGKAVKIEKKTPLNDSSFVKEWSYWTKNASRIATFGYWGSPDKSHCIRRSVNIPEWMVISELPDED
ncbi:MAG: hypothetical protein K2K51_06310 [Bacteroidales bacterium]|nr:hypothetical protein [Bacteroidales bacterium]